MSLSALLYSQKVIHPRGAFYDLQRIKHFADIVSDADTLRHITAKVLVLRLEYFHIIV